MLVSVSTRAKHSAPSQLSGFSQSDPISQCDANQLLIGIIHGQLAGQVNLPHGLGLEYAAYHGLLLELADETLLAADKHWQNMGDNHLTMRSTVLGELLAMQLAERNELVSLLLEYAAEDAQHVDSVAVMVATACLSPAHLWKSLGLTSRQQLRQLLTFFFPQLVALNQQNMRWKRFFYRCLCERSGDYVCKAPNCVDCSSYQECFTAE
ncbi:nitrogen fixation protein NifQ [Neiella sp. HB171785]|uniref:Nitrogen fixation protein NifQ n=1 Tax=Neiella litorisoli TaxID=2771431 RepID=A0A8J6UI76_9GAMM|nr:nitrogen fixation protein NifQ [Neiella litorisoli]MBD1388218.1 nitrogen fixation protein NifQ [Neiella litorisoli]